MYRNLRGPLREQRDPRGLEKENVPALTRSASGSVFRNHRGRAPLGSTNANRHHRSRTPEPNLPPRMARIDADLAKGPASSALIRDARRKGSLEGRKTRRTLPGLPEKISSWARPGRIARRPDLLPRNNFPRTPHESETRGASHHAGSLARPFTPSALRPAAAVGSESRFDEE